MLTGVRSTRRGFTFVEIMVVLGIMAVLAAILIPQLASRSHQSEVGALSRSIGTIREGILEYRGDVRRYPRHIRHLSAKPASATDLCGQSVPSSFLDNWRGPYVGQTITTSGIHISDATVLDSLERSPSTFTASTTGTLSILVQTVDSSVARDLERSYDTSADFASGTVRWTQVAGMSGTLKFVIPVRGC